MHIVNACGHFWESTFLQETMFAQDCHKIMGFATCTFDRQSSLPHFVYLCNTHLQTCIGTFIYFQFYAQRKEFVTQGNKVKEKSSSYSFGHKKEPHSVVKSLIQCCMKMHVNVAMPFSRLLYSTSVTELVIIHCFLNSPSFQVYFPSSLTSRHHKYSKGTIVFLPFCDAREHQDVPILIKKKNRGIYLYKVTFLSHISWEITGCYATLFLSQQRRLPLSMTVPIAMEHSVH